MTKVWVGVAVLLVVLAVRGEWVRRTAAAEALRWEATATKAVTMAEDVALREEAAKVRIAGLTFEADSLREAARRASGRVRVVRDTLVVLPPAPDTCRPWADRANVLAGLLDVQSQATAAALLASVRDSAAAAEALALVVTGAAARDSLVAVLEARPRPARKAALEAMGQLEADPDGVTGTLALRKGALYAGARWRPTDGRVEQRWVVGVQQSLRLW